VLFLMVSLLVLIMCDQCSVRWFEDHCYERWFCWLHDHVLYDSIVICGISSVCSFLERNVLTFIGCNNFHSFASCD
jgi:hypothetical protein